jgi:Abnormal spindle-like microcephaly-assoc'd, ASPM-SPD-2-Hydin
MKKAALLIVAIICFGIATNASAYLEVNPTMHDFGYVEIGSSASFIITVTARRLDTSFTTFFTEDWENNDSISVSPSSDSLSINETVTLTVTFTPKSNVENRYFGSLYINSNDGRIVYTQVLISGWGSEDVTLYVAPTLIDFGTLDFGSSTSRIVQVTNNHPADTYFITGDIGGLSSGEFSVQNNCSNLGPGSTCEMAVNYNALRIGKHYDSLVIADNNYFIRTVQLTGETVDVSADVSDDDISDASTNNNIGVDDDGNVLCFINCLTH